MFGCLGGYGGFEVWGFRRLVDLEFWGFGNWGDWGFSVLGFGIVGFCGFQVSWFWGFGM